MLLRFSKQLSVRARLSTPAPLRKVLVSPTRRNQSSLNNPMFPEAPIKATVETPKVTKGDDESFLSRHGGKVAAVAIGISVGLIYSYILSGRSRNEVEDKLVAEAAIEPYEVGASRPLKVNVFFLKAQLLQVNELRFKNNLNQEVYDKLTVEALRRFPNGLAGYVEFVGFVQGFLKDYNERNNATFVIQAGHLFDRNVLYYLLDAKTSNTGKYVVQGEKEGSVGRPNSVGFGGDGDVSGWRDNLAIDGESTQIGVGDVAEAQIPVRYMLVMLNMAMKTPASERITSLFKIATTISDSDPGTTNTAEIVVDSSNSNGSESNSSRDNSEGGDGNLKDNSDGAMSVSATVTDSDKDESCSIAAVEDVIGFLADSWQLPPEKRIVETGVKFPVKTYRRKTASEMVKSFRKHNKPPHESPRFTKAQFEALMLSSYVCAWAECYRGRN